MEAVYRTLGCVTRKSRGDAICTNHHTISEKKVMRALVNHLRDRLSRPDRVETFVAAFKAKFAAHAKPDIERVGLANRIAQQEVFCANITKALVHLPDSLSVQAEVKKQDQILAQLRQQLAAMPEYGHKVLPHPSAIAGWVEKLTEIIEVRPLEAAAILRRVLTPFRVVHRNGRTVLTGALDLGFCDSKSSGGVI